MTRPVLISAQEQRKDMYEPLIMDVLRHEKNNLGHVIFGSECWIQLATEAGIPMSPATDALSLFYKPSE